jgi:hypothetical protein
MAGPWETVAVMVINAYGTAEFRNHTASRALAKPWVWSGCVLWWLCFETRLAGRRVCMASYTRAGGNFWKGGVIWNESAALVSWF